jgi:DNA repair exonuclease SbcCD ATPase subunit
LSNLLGARALSLTEPHNEFLELCAVSTSGQLTDEEQKRLHKHLAVCQSCREILRQYEAVANRAIPFIAAGTPSDDLEPEPDWSLKRAENSFAKRLQEERHGPIEFKNANGISPPPYLRPFSSEPTWRQVWMLYAAGILLFVSLSFYAYWAGVHRGIDTSKAAPPQPSTQSQVTLAAQLSNARDDRQVARAQVEQRDKTIGDLRQQLARQMAEINTMKGEQDQLEDDLRASEAGRHGLAEQRTELTQKLDAALTASQGLQQKLDSVARQSAQDIARAKALEATVDDLNRLLHDRETALDQKDELLAHDRDIRDLMGARDLYIAEVYDVVGTGETQKPYGRVFYTRGKSLIFYAYDLDQQTATKTVNAFQAWGRRGPDQQKALNLGVFYEDNASKKRWILKCDDPKTLAQIDGVFVTVEPDGGSQKPSGKSLLFAYLKADSNHP